MDRATKTFAEPIFDSLGVGATRQVAVATTAAMPAGSLSFYALARYDLTTDLTLAAFRAARVGDEEQQFGQSAVSSLPQSWREL